MKKLLLLLCFLQGIIFAECAFVESVDKMEDKKEYIFSCITDGNELYYFSNQPKPRPKYGAIYISPNKKEDLYLGMFAIKNVTEHGESTQTIRIKFDKGQPFSETAVIFNNAGSAVVDLKDKYYQQFLKADKVVIEYETFKNTKNQIEIDVSELKTIDFKVGSIIKVTKIAFGCENKESLLKTEKAGSRATKKQPFKMPEDCVLFSEYSGDGELKILEVEENYIKVLPLGKEYQNKTYWINSDNFF